MTGEYLVAGAGPSGLAAAYRLQQAGHRVRVLEATARVGSKMCSETRDGFVLDRAAVFITPGYDRLLALAGEIGALDDVVEGDAVFGLVRDSTIHEIDARRPLGALGRTEYLSGRAKLTAAAKLAPEAWRARTVSRERIAEAGRYDSCTLAEWADRHLSPDLAEYLIGAAIRSTYGAEPEQLSRVELLGVLALMKGARLQNFRGGLQTYADKLASGLDVTLEAKVLEVIQRADHAEVTWADREGQEHTDTCDGCVVALPADAAAKARSDIDPWRAANLLGIKQGEIIMVSVGLDRPPPGLTATYTMLARPENRALVAIVADHHKAPGRVPDGKGLVTLIFETGWSAEHYEDDDQTIVEAALAIVEPYLPGTGDHTEFVRVSRWYQQYPQVGHYAALGEMKAIARRADRTVHLAGEYLYAPNLNAATASGEDAARALLAARYPATDKAWRN